MRPISFYIIAKNEIFWIEPCILSIAKIANEIVFIDNGSDDGTLDKVKLIRETYNLPIRVYRYPPNTDLSEVRNFGISKCKNEWVFTWDADFVAFEDDSAHSLRNFLTNIERQGLFERYQQLNIAVPIMKFLMGKMQKDVNVHPNNCILFNKRFVKIAVDLRHGWDKSVKKKGAKSFTIKQGAAKTGIDLYYYITIDVKSDMHIMLRRFRSRWRQELAKGKQIGLFEYVIGLGWDLEKERESLHSKLNDLIDFSYDIPIFLKPYVSNPPYKLHTKDGKIDREFDYDRLKSLDT